MGVCTEQEKQSFRGDTPDLCLKLGIWKNIRESGISLLQIGILELDEVCYPSLPTTHAHDLDPSP